MLYIAAQFSGSGKIFNETFKIDPFWGMVIGSMIVTVYTMLGGFITVVATDVFQAILMVITCVALPIIDLFIAAAHGIGIADALVHTNIAVHGNQDSGAAITGFLLILNKFLTLMVGVVAFMMAITMKDTVYGLVSYAWSGIGASFGPAVILLLFWKKFSRAGVFASLITGTVAAIIWKTWLAIPTGISERLASFMIAFAAAVIFSLAFPGKTPENNGTDLFSFRSVP